jgi:MYXO-CTERM domain-containing protein
LLAGGSRTCCSCSSASARTRTRTTTAAALGLIVFVVAALGFVVIVVLALDRVLGPFGQALDHAHGVEVDVGPFEREQLAGT